MDHDNSSKRKASNVRPSICLFFLAFLVNFYAAVGVNAAEDILVGSDIPTSTVVLTMSVTLASFDVFSTWLTVSSSWNMVRLLLGMALITIAAVLIPTGSNVYLRLFFAATAAAGVGVISIVCVSLCAVYQELGVSAFGAGSGAGNIFAAIYYTAISTWMCLGYKWALPLSSIFAPGFIVCYLALTKPDILQRLRKGYTHLSGEDDDTLQKNEDHSQKPAEVRELKQVIDLDSFEDNVTQEDKESNTDIQECKLSQQESGESEPLCVLTCKRKIEVFKEAFAFVLLPVCVSVFSEMTTFQSITTTIAFRNSPFAPRSHYSYYSLAFYSGLCILRMYLYPIVQCCPSWISAFRIRKLWVIAIMQVSFTLLFLFASLYRFLPNVWITMVMIFLQGGLGGVVYVCGLLNASELSEPGFAASLVESGFMVTASFSCFSGLFIEKVLVDHCMDYYMGNEAMQLLCLTRNQNTTGILKC